MPILFPSSPTTGQTYTYNNRTWIYNGTAWDTNSTTSVASAAAPITYNASTQTVGLDRTILPANPFTPALTLKPNSVQNSNLQEWQSNAGAILGSVDTAGNASFQNANYAGKNAIINGGFDIWQRGTSVAGGVATYVSDRWMGYRGAYASGSTYSRQPSGLEGIRYCMRVQRDSGNSATNALFLDNPLDTDSSIQFQGKLVTFSFYARAGANLSSTSSLIGFSVYGGTGIDQKAVSGFTNQVTMHNATFALTSSWQKFTTTFSVGSNINGFTPELFYIPTGTAGANDWFEVTGVQLELGTVSTPFSRAGGTIQGELAACQRYYFRQTANSGFAALSSHAPAGASNQMFFVMTVPVSMRGPNTSVDWGGNLGLSDGFNTQTNISTIVASGGVGYTQVVNITMTSSSLTQFRSYRLADNGANTAFIGISAEL